MFINGRHYFQVYLINANNHKSRKYGLGIFIITNWYCVILYDRSHEKYPRPFVYGGRMLSKSVQFERIAFHPKYCLKSLSHDSHALVTEEKCPVEAKFNFWNKKKIFLNYNPLNQTLYFSGQQKPNRLSSW